MDWELLQFGLGELVDIELAIIVLVAGLAVACIGPLLAMGGRGEIKDDGGHPLRSRLHTAEPIQTSHQPLTPGKMKLKTRVKTR